MGAFLDQGSSYEEELEAFLAIQDVILTFHGVAFLSDAFNVVPETFLTSLDAFREACLIVLGAFSEACLIVLGAFKVACLIMLGAFEVAFQVVLGTFREAFLIHFIWTFLDAAFRDAFNTGLLVEPYLVDLDAWEVGFRTIHSFHVENLVHLAKEHVIFKPFLDAAYQDVELLN